jgi:hypothetical protein
MPTTTVARVADYLPEYRVAFAVAYASALVAMLLTYLYVAGAGVRELNPVTRAAFALLPETAGVRFAVVLGGKAVVLLALYRLVLPWAATAVHAAFGTPLTAARRFAAWSGAGISGLDAGLNLFAPLVYPAPTLTSGVSVFMAAFLVAVVVGFVAMPDRNALGGGVETTDERPPLSDVEVSD